MPKSDCHVKLQARIFAIAFVLLDSSVRTAFVERSCVSRGGGRRGEGLVALAATFSSPHSSLLLTPRVSWRCYRVLLTAGLEGRVVGQDPLLEQVAHLGVRVQPVEAGRPLVEAREVALEAVEDILRERVLRDQPVELRVGHLRDEDLETLDEALGQLRGDGGVGHLGTLFREVSECVRNTSYSISYKIGYVNGYKTDSVMMEIILDSITGVREDVDIRDRTPK